VGQGRKYQNGNYGRIWNQRMNNQLRKIVEQAVSAVDIVTGNEALDDELAKMYIPDCFAEKFAELIVKECEVALKPPVQVRNVISRGQAYDLIKKHFGVEE
jgi:flagellar motor switch protein FliM